MVLELFSTCGSILENNKDKFTNANENTVGNNNLALSSSKGAVDQLSQMGCGGTIMIIILIVICTLPAVVIAVKCNPRSPVIMGIVAFFFDRIYLFQHVVRKYLMREKNYCKNIYCK
jgi:hypothetical protein